MTAIRLNMREHNLRVDVDPTYGEALCSGRREIPIEGVVRFETIVEGTPSVEELKDEIMKLKGCAREYAELEYARAIQLYKDRVSLLEKED